MSHTPGRGHRRKSDPKKRRRFRKREASKLTRRQKAYANAVKRWAAMTDEQQLLLPEFHPDNFKP
jgi:hypothetical protein